jgi:hypothetical protein
MAEEPAGTEPESGRPEAAARIANQRDTFRSELEQLATTTLTVDHAYLGFKGMEGFAGDPYAAAKAAAQAGVRYDPADPEGFGERLTGWWSEQKQILGISDAPPPPSATPPGEQPVVYAAKVPGSTGPSPAAGGGTPPVEMLTWASPEVQELYKKNDLDGIKKLISDGRFQPTPGNPAAAAASRKR